MRPVRSRCAIMTTTLAAVLAFSILALPAPAPAGQVYGTAPDLAVATPVSEILAKPADYVGKVVKVQGMIVEVCASRGCWLELGGDKAFETIRVKVQDGVIVFPTEILGSTVIAEGVWTANKLDMETTKAYCNAKAEKAGEKFNPESVTECMTLYQVTGTGAVALETAAAPKADTKADPRALEAVKPQHKG